MADFDVNKKVMTVKQVMKAIGARSPSTVHRLIRSKKLAGTKVGSMGYLVCRDSVAKFAAADSQRDRTVGFPRGESRSESDAPASKKKPRR